MSLLTDDDKALLVLEHLGPPHLLATRLAGDKMSLYDCFHLALDVAEKSLLAKLASAELPEPFPAGYIAQTEYFYTADQLRQAYAQGAASQLSAVPVAARVWVGSYEGADHENQYVYSEDGDGEPLFTLKEPK